MDVGRGEQANPGLAGTPAPAITGTLTPGGANSPIANRHIVLCLRQDSSDLTCTLTTLATTSDSAGHFEFATVPAGNYLVFYDSGWDAFEAGLTKWTGKAIHVGDVKWLASNYFDSSNGSVSLMFPSGAKVDPTLDLYRFFGQSPFFWAHTCADGNCNSTDAVVPVEYDITDGSHQDATFVVYSYTKN
jgi:hypothetical protein